MNLLKYYIYLMFSFFAANTWAFEGNTLMLHDSNWKLQNALFVYEEGENISKDGYHARNWLKATVPGTSFGSYVDAGVFPDPYYADNMNKIPDEFFSANKFWYRHTLEAFKPQKEKRYFLHFKGINWKADVYFNGHQLGRIEGAFQRAAFDITNLISEKNTLAVLIHPIEHWKPGDGKVTRKFLGAPTTNGDVSGYDSPAFLAASGWNWLPVVRGRNTGIWNDVYIRETADVTVHDAWVSPVLSLPDTTKAALTVEAKLKNHSGSLVSGILKFETEKISIDVPVTLAAGEKRVIRLTPKDFKALNIRNPRLWWPNGYGQPNLYKSKVSFVVNEKQSDVQEFNFGIRDIRSEVKNNILFLYCNGVRMLVRGGNWGLPEGMLRVDSAAYDLRVRLHKEANFNMIRNWVGQTGHEEFYDACDRYGILIWDDFWLANPVDGPTPKDTALFMSNVRDKISWVRKHTSVALYCGRNEGLPPADLDTAMHRAVRSIDGTRLYLSESADGVVTGLGPYDVRPVKWYFENRGYTFHSEQGIIAFPEAESMERMLPEKYWWPINDMWAIHDYQWDRSFKFTNTIETRYGAPQNMQDYSRRAQLLNYESAKAMFECLQSNQGSGVLLWMSQAAWPSMICQLYDHYFEYTSAYFAAKKASRPVHVLYDPRTSEVKIANNTAKGLKGALVKATVFDPDAKKLMEKQIRMNVQPTSAKTCFTLKMTGFKELVFLKLELIKADGSIIDNFYWLENSNGNCLALNAMKSAAVQMSHVVQVENGKVKVKLTLHNNTNHISLMNKIKIKDKKGLSVLPVFYNDNYVSLVPGEQKDIFIEFDALLTNPETSAIWVEARGCDVVKIPLFK